MPHPCLICRTTLVTRFGYLAGSNLETQLLTEDLELHKFYGRLRVQQLHLARAERTDVDVYMLWTITTHALFVL